MAPLLHTQKRVNIYFSKPLKCLNKMTFHSFCSRYYKIPIRPINTNVYSTYSLKKVPYPFLGSPEYRGLQGVPPPSPQERDMKLSIDLHSCNSPLPSTNVGIHSPDYYKKNKRSNIIKEPGETDFKNIKIIILVKNE